MDLISLARQLMEAETSQNPIDPLTAKYPEMSVDDAYQIQLAIVGNRLKQGHKIIGKKIGLTSEGMQQLLHVNEPDYGHLFDNMILDEGHPCQRSTLIRPRVEGELAFVLKDRLMGPGINVADVYRATAGIMPAIEIVDSRIKSWKIKLEDTIADNASSARLVIGQRMVAIEAVDLYHVGMVLHKNGRMINNGTGAAVLGHPANAVAWLANKLSAYDIALEPGEIILSGAITGAVDAEADDNFTVSFHGLGTLHLRFE